MSLAPMTQALSGNRVAKFLLSDDTQTSVPPPASTRFSRNAWPMATLWTRRPSARCR